MVKTMFIFTRKKPWIFAKMGFQTSQKAGAGHEDTVPVQGGGLATDLVQTHLCELPNLIQSKNTINKEAKSTNSVEFYVCLLVVILDDMFIVLFEIVLYYMLHTLYFVWMILHCNVLR